MTPCWIIVIPAWGDRCVRCFLDFGLPAIKAALKHTKHPVTFHIYTDQQERIVPALAGLPYQFCKRPTLGNPHRMLGAVHGHAMRNAKSGQHLVFLNADHVPSVECFAASEARFSQGKKMVVCAGLRTTSDVGPPIGEASRELLKWMWANPHMHTSECVWGAGRSDQPSVLMFVNGGSVAAHAFHLHPFAVKIDGRNLGFTGVTIDDDLPTLFKRAEIHVVTDADEMSLAEMSPPDFERWKLYPSPMMIKHVAVWARQKFKNGRPFVNNMHKWFFTHRICIVGDGHGDNTERERVAEILAAVG